MRSLTRWMACGAAAGALLAGTAEALDVGQPAPELNVSTWIKGGPVSIAGAKGKHVLVVEFWATWCGPCRRTIPHLSQLQARHKDDGLIVVGITDEKVDLVKRWLQSTGLKMDYTVGSDPSKQTSRAYDVEGIPHAAVVDKTGTVVWIGHPMDNMDYVVKEVLAGTYDPKTAENHKQMMRDLQKALQENRFDQALQILDKLIQAQPANLDLYQLKLRILEHTRKTQEMAAVRQAMLKAFADDPRALNNIAWQLLTADDLASRDLKLGLATAQKAVELSARKEATILDTLARAYAELGLWDQAIQIATEALTVASEEDKKRVQQALDYYKQAKALAAEYAAKPAGKPR